MKSKINWSLTAFLLFFGVILWMLFDTHILQLSKSGDLLTGESTYGDLPFHLSMISQMSYGKIFPPENPLFALHPLKYPYAINLFSAVLVNFGMSLRDSIILPGMLFSMLSAILLYFFYYSISKNKNISLVASLLFWLNGGLGFYFFSRDVFFKGLFQDFLESPGRFQDYSHLFTENIQWNNYLSRIIVPERSVLLGIPMGLLILYLLFIKGTEIKAVFGKELALSAILTGLLPISHTHTFMVFALVIPLMAFMTYRGMPFRTFIFRYLIFGLIVIVISLPQLVGILSHVGGSQEFMKFRLGWLAKPGLTGFILFWFKNAGVLIPLMFVSLFLKSVPGLAKKFTICGLVILVLINLIQFQPYDWDNIKLLFWTSVFGSLSASFVLNFIWRKYQYIGKLVAVVLFAALTLSASLSIYREVHLQHGLFSHEEVLLGDWVRDEAQTDAIFLTAPIHNSFVNNFGGRRILMGYPGLLWTQGYNYAETEKNLKEIYAGVDYNFKLIKKYGIDYIVIGPRETSDVKANLKFFENNFCLVKKTSNYKIYKVDCKK